LNSNSNPLFIFSKLKIYFAIFIGLIISGYLLFTEFKTSGFQNISTNINWTYSSFMFLALAIIMMVIRDFAYMVRIKLLTDNHLSWKQAFKVILIWEFASTVTPGVVGGSAVAMFILNKEKIALAKSTSIVIITTLFDNLFYIIYVPILIYFINPNNLIPQAIHRFGFNLFWMGYFVIFIISSLLILSLFVYPQLIKIIFNFIFRIPFLKRFQSKFDKFGDEISIASQYFKKKSIRFWLQIFLSTTISWFARFLVVNFIILAFVSLNFTDHLIILGRQFVMWLALLITPTPGGSGMAEYLFNTFLYDYIPLKTLAILLALLWRLISYYPYLIIGLLILPTWIKENNT
jgi:hypothetical protein